MASEILALATFRGDAASVQALLTVGAGTTATVLSVTICETAGAAETFNLLIDDGGGGADTYLEAGTDDTIKFYVAGAHDLTVSSNAINVLSGTTLTIDSGATIANSGTATGFGAVTALNNATANELVTIGSTTTELDAESTLTFDGSALVVGGTNPSITIGDAGTEDTKLVFDGNAQDFYIGLDDTADDLVIGVGSAVGTTPAISIDEDRVITFAAGTSVVNSGTWSPYTVSTGKSLVMGI